MLYGGFVATFAPAVWSVPVQATLVVVWLGVQLIGRAITGTRAQP